MIKLFREKVEIKDKKLGVLSARVKYKDPNKNYTWSSNIEFENNDLSILIIGNYLGPHKNQKEGIISLLESWNSIKLALDKYVRKLAVNQSLENEYKNWKNEFYLEAIYPENETDNSFELIIESKNNSDHYISFTYRNNKIEEVELK